MAPYFVLLGMWIAGTIQFSSRRTAGYERFVYGAALLSTIVMIGLRYEVGGDWLTYDEMYVEISRQPLGVALRITEPGFAFLNWLSARVDGYVYVPNLASAFIFMLGLSRLVRRQPRPWLAMTVAIPYLVIVVGMGYTRQAAAIGILCWAIAGVGRDRIWQTVAKVAFAALFHKTAILFMPILLAPVIRRNLLTGIVGSLAFVALAFVALGGSTDQFVANYVNSDYQSGGAAIRIAMNVIAAGLFFYFRKRLPISDDLKLIWTVVSSLALVSVAGLVYSASSVGVDRLALFLIPLQVFVFANIPTIPRVSGLFATLSTIAVISYSFAVQYVYFVHGTYSYTWLPYRNILLMPSADVDEM